jgi:hypothetical protein
MDHIKQYEIQKQQRKQYNNKITFGQNGEKYKRP